MRNHPSLSVDQGRRVTILTAVLIAAMVVSCTTPYSLALRGALTGNGVSGSNSVTFTELPASLVLSGSYSVESGSLSMAVIAPGGDRPFEAVYGPGESGTIDQTLIPAVGDWELVVTSADAVGSYELRLNY